MRRGQSSNRDINLFRQMRNQEIRNPKIELCYPKYSLKCSARSTIVLRPKAVPPSV